jgi:cysteine desulfurase / selenocysteine lyase
MKVHAIKPTSSGALNPEKLRKDFPILSQKVHGKPLVYLDNAATSQKPTAVLDEITRFYSEDYANIHRGVHVLSQRSTEKYEEARAIVQRHVGAKAPEEIIFVRGTTEGINLVAQTYGRANVKTGDEILVTTMEHHSNIVPWQMLCEQTGAKLRVVPINDAGEVILEEYKKLLGPQTKIVSTCHVSNSLGTVNPIKTMIDLAHKVGAIFVVDGAQAIPHMQVNVHELDADFYVFSGHKVYGPSGIGALYGKKKILEAMPPYQGGGDMIRSVTFEKTTYNDLPNKFEAGTPNIVGAAALATALQYVAAIGLDKIATYETELLEYATDELGKIPQVRIVGTAQEKASVLSFTIEGIHPHDIGTILDREGIAIRAGHHCCQPLMERFGVPATARASFSFYNTTAEIDILVRGVKMAIGVFGG